MPDNVRFKGVLGLAPPGVTWSTPIPLRDDNQNVIGVVDEIEEVDGLMHARGWILQQHLSGSGMHPDPDWRMQI